MNKKNKGLEYMNKPKEKMNQDSPSTLPGWPGYRTRDDRSGYDPIDTRIEAAHTAGAFIRGLFTGKLRIKNPAFLISFGYFRVGPHHPPYIGNF